MNYMQANEILDARRAGVDMPEDVVTMALEMTGDYAQEFEFSSIALMAEQIVLRRVRMTEREI